MSNTKPYKKHPVSAFITVQLTKEDAKRIKAYALKQNQSMSFIVRAWIREQLSEAAE